MNDTEFNEWVMDCPEEKWRHSSGLPEGQILRGHPFGELIFDIACDRDYKNYLEIGTWCGRGTTRCFLDGIIPRDDEACLQAIESNTRFYNITENYWTKYFEYKQIDEKKLDLVFGSVVGYEELDENYITDSGHNKETYDYNLDIKSAPLIKIERPVDVLCLDGGHFSTLPEWEMFKDQIKVIILDDTGTSKTRKIVEELNSGSTWNIIYNSQQRNGEMVALKSSP